MTSTVVLISIGQRAREPTIHAILIHRACPSACNDIIGSHPRLPAPTPLSSSPAPPVQSDIISPACCTLLAAAAAAAAPPHWRSTYSFPDTRSVCLGILPIYSLHDLFTCARAPLGDDGYWSRRGRMPITCGMHRDARSKAIYAYPREI